MKLFLILLLFFTPVGVFAQTKTCSSIGYSIYTINGINTSIDGATENRDALKNLLLYQSSQYNNQKLTVDFLYNQTHSLGIDLLDSLNQKNFEQNLLYIEDSDFAQMLTDASEKVTTQKLLLVGHSQGNFYANTFYNAVADQLGGVPSESLSVYSVATPANHVEGGGLYLTSDTDTVIKDFAAKAPLTNTLPANVHIDFSDNSNGHSFSDIYLKYQGDRIISDIKTSLDRLQNNNIQKENSSCINPPKLTLTQKIQGTALVIIDGSVHGFNKTTNFVGEKYLALINNTGKILANAIDSIMGGNSAAVILATNPESQDAKPDSTNSPQAEPPKPAPENPQESPKIIVKTPAPENVAIQDSAPATTETPMPPAVLTPVDIISNPVATNTTPENSPLLGGGGIAAVNLVNFTPAPPLPPPPIPLPPPPPDTTAPVITILGNNPEAMVLNSTYADAGATALDDIDGVISVVTSGNVDTSVLGLYTLTYTATDASGNIATATRNVRVSSRVYVPKYKFGADNGDGNDWQVWAFNGSNIYDWSDTYVNHYLNQQFKVQHYPGFHCSQCLLKGIFTRNPLEGFEVSDIFMLTSIDNDSFQFGIDRTSDINIQWDSLGYTYTVTNESTSNIDASGHTDIPNVDSNMWVGWSTAANQFDTFPSGNFVGVPPFFIDGRTGGSSMVLQPYPVYAP